MEHYWPGATISIPYTEDYDTRVFDSLPRTWPLDPTNPNATPGAYQKGYDTGYPSLAQGLGTLAVTTYSTVFNVVGEGREVTFIVHGHTPDEYFIDNGGLLASSNHLPVSMYLLVPGYQSNIHTGWPLGQVAFASSGNASSDAVAAITWFLNEGETYYLVVNGSNYTEAFETLIDPQGVIRTMGYHRAGMQFHVDFRHTQRNSNDLRVNAADVIIAADGEAYETAPAGIVNDTLTAYTTVDPSGGYPDDQPGNDANYTAWWLYQPESNGSFNAVFTTEPNDFAYGRMVAYREEPDGTLTELQDDWNINITATANTKYWISLGADLNFQSPGQIYHLRVQGKRSVVQAPAAASKNPNKHRPPAPPPAWPDPGGLPVDKFNPIATQPARDTGEDTLLNLVRAFSSAVKRAVRITGPTTIEMVDPGKPLPAGWTTSDASNLYRSASRASAATDIVLSTNAGTVAVTGSADLVADDLRLVRSSWRIPDRLPTYGLPPAPVKRVTYTFSPQGFRASVEFHFPAAPFAARRP